MSKTTKRKHVTQEALTEYYVPEGEEEIVKVSSDWSLNFNFISWITGGISIG